MATVIAAYGLHLGRPLWLLAALLAVPAVWMAWRNLRQFDRPRRFAILLLRCAVILLLALLLAEPLLVRKHEALTVIAVADESQSVPADRRQAAQAYLAEALAAKPAEDRVALVCVAEAARIARLPSNDPSLDGRRNFTLLGQHSALGDGLEMGMAIAPPDSAVRILLVSDGNETVGDLREVARVAAANRIPVDVLPLRYDHEHEVVFRRLIAPRKARSGQTVPIRFVLHSTQSARGRLRLELNGRALDLDPDSDAVEVPVSLEPGTNVKTVSLSVGLGGVQEFEAVFVPDSPADDALAQNNSASAVTFVSGPGRLLVLDADGGGRDLASALTAAHLFVDYQHVGALPTDLARMTEIDAVILVNVEASAVSTTQQEMLVRYVNDLGGGLVMVGGPESFGAGGWIGSPVARVLPVDLDPPQQREMPKGALVLIMHACEMPDGNRWGKEVAIAAVKALSHLDLVGVLDYSWNGGALANWVYPLSPAGDKTAVVNAIQRMEMGDMPDFHAPLQAAYDALTAQRVGQRHIIIISDGDPNPPSTQLLSDLRDARITVTGVEVFPHGGIGMSSLQQIATATGGRFYNPTDPNALPQIFIKEAQLVRRSMIVEETFTPRLVGGLSELIQGLAGEGVPTLEGYVLTGPKGGLAQVILDSPKGDPVLAAQQSGLGRTVAFTSSADSVWAPAWLGWGGYGRFWEQIARWVGRSGQNSECEVYADVQGRSVVLTVEAVDTEGQFTQFSQLSGQAIAPDMSGTPIPFSQVGPGRYRGEFRADQSGSYLLNLQHTDTAGVQGTTQAVVTMPYAPEFRHLTDNHALLAEVARLTGGRVLPADPKQANLFDRGGMRFPQTPLPLAKPLLLIWLAAFLLDVAVRRVAMDVRAAAARVRNWLRPSEAARPDEQTMQSLRTRRQEIRDQHQPMPGAPSEPIEHNARRRFDADVEAPREPVELPMADVTVPGERRRPPPGAPAGGLSGMQRLKQAKRQAQDLIRKEQEQDEK